MRLMVTFRSLGTFSHDLRYFHKVHGFIYGLLRGTPYEVLHEKKGYKFFCFSNLFPLNVKNGVPQPVEKGEEKKLLISSPDRIFIRTVRERLEEFAREGEPVKIGEMRFTVEGLKEFKKAPGNLIAATPIVLRIPERRYREYGIKNGKRGYVYWRPEHGLEPFLKQLEDNMFKKYAEFSGETERFPVFEILEFRGMRVCHLVIDGVEYRVIGSLWKFSFPGLRHDPEKRKLLSFAMDCGFGERNTYGFGFVNPVRPSVARGRRPENVK